VNITTVPYLTDLSDVVMSSLANTDMIQYDADTEVFRNVPNVNLGNEADGEWRTPATPTALSGRFVNVSDTGAVRFVLQGTQPVFSQVNPSAPINSKIINGSLGNDGKLRIFSSTDAIATKAIIVQVDLVTGLTTYLMPFQFNAVVNFKAVTFFDLLATFTTGINTRFIGPLGGVDDDLLELADQLLKINGGLNVGGVTKLGDGGTSHYTEVETDGTVKFVGAAKVWNDIQFSLATARVPASNAPTWATFGVNTNKYTFGVNDYVDLEGAEVYHSYAHGTNLHFHVHFYNNGLDAGDRTVKYQIDYGITAPNGVYSESTISLQLTIPDSSADKTHFNFDIAEVDGTSFVHGSDITMRFTRIVEDSGTAPSGDPFVSMVGIHIEEDTVGSREELTK
jgi:hypothetical protein